MDLGSGDRIVDGGGLRGGIHPGVAGQPRGPDEGTALRVDGGVRHSLQKKSWLLVGDLDSFGFCKKLRVERNFIVGGVTKDFTFVAHGATDR